MAWVLAPVLWAMISLGLGGGVRWMTRGRLAGGLVLPVGFATFIVLANLMMMSSVTAALTMLVLACLALAGGYLDRWQVRRPAAAPVISALIVFVLYGLPSIVSGAPFMGWIKLDDGASWLAFTDRLADAGRTVTGLAPSSYEAVLQINWDQANAGGPYPVGVFTPLAAVSQWLPVDVAWLLQPYLAFLAAVLALVIHELLKDHVAPNALRAGLTVVAALPALLVGYAFWGGIKELALAPLLALVVVLAVGRLTLPLTVVTASVLAVAGFSGGAWLVLPLLVWLVVVRDWRRVVTFGVGVSLLSVPLLVGLSPEAVTSLFGFASGSTDIGNLTGPLSRLQVLGIWPVADFREVPAMAPVYVLLAAVGLLAAIGLWRCGVGRIWAVALYVVNMLAIATVFSFGNAWVAGKGLAMASPAALTAAAVGIGWFWSQRRMVEAWVGTGLLTAGVVWSYALAYHGVWLAPAEQLREMQAIGRDESLGRPALMLEYSPYGVRHFLRGLDAEGAGELRRRTIPTVEGGTVEKAEYADIDRISQQALADFPTLVLRRSPIASRPPSTYRLARSETFYDVWERDPAARAIVSHTPFGAATDPAEVPECSVITDIAATAEPGDQLAYVERSPLITVPLGSDGTITPTSALDLERDFRTGRAGRYDLALGGSFAGAVTVRIDGEEVWTGRHHLNWTGNTTPAGSVELSPGQHRVTIEYDSSPLQPGSGSGPWPMGPVYLSLPTPPVAYVDPPDAKSLCGKRLDWVEVVR